MIALDTNIILHLLVKSQENHSRVYDWFLKNHSPLCTTDINIAEVLRLITHLRVFPSPLKLEKAISLVHEFYEGFEVKILEEPQEWWLELKDLLKYNSSLRGNEIFDAQIAICLRYHGVKEILTFDADFSKYSFLKIVKI